MIKMLKGAIFILNGIVKGVLSWATRLGQLFVLGLGRVTHFWFGFGKFPLKISNFLFFPWG